MTSNNNTPTPIGSERSSTQTAESPWLKAHEAAAYLRCSLSRVRKLTSTRDLPHEKDGSRVLYHRDALDQFVRNGGAISP